MKKERSEDCVALQREITDVIELTEKTLKIEA